MAAERAMKSESAMVLLYPPDDGQLHLLGACATHHVECRKPSYRTVYRDF